MLAFKTSQEPLRSSSKKDTLKSRTPIKERMLPDVNESYGVFRPLS